MIDVVNATKIVKEHGKNCECSTCDYARNHMRHCDDCNKLHEKIAFCDKCGSCLYEHSTQIKNEMYPLFECTNCGAVNFWD